MEKTIKYLENGEYHYATVRSVGDLAQLKTNSKETLVEAINELWNGGGNADPSKAPKPEGYDQLVQDVADAVKNQQEISQQWIEWQNEEAQLTEERKQAYLQAMKEMQEAVDKAKADAAALDDKTAKLDEQITKTFSDLDTNIQNMHEQLQKEADRMNKDLQDTKGTLSTLRTDLQNTQMDNGKIHDELTNINGKFEHKVWQTDLDPLKEQIDRAETSVQQTKDELLGKASRQDLDTVSNTVSKLDTQLKETAKGVEISVKKDELGGEIAEALTNKTNILLGTRRFTTNNWTQRDHVEICSDPWKGFLVVKQNSPIEGIQQAYDVKAGTTYTFSLFAKMDNLDDGNKPQIILAKNNLDTSLDTKIDMWRKDIEDITSDFKRYDLTFTPSEDCTIYPHVISNSNNPIFVCGYQLEIGKELTPWEPNQEDVGDYVEKSEAQFNVYNDKIQALTEKQRQQGDTQEKLRTEVTQTAEGIKQVSESLKDTNGDITKLRGDLERTADHMKSEYETYTNKAVGQISDSTLNLIRNSSFQNKDEDFAQWQNVSAKANIRQDENGLRWVELTQSGMTADNIIGLTSNYFNIKQGKVTVAVDIKNGTKADLDIESVLTLELYDENKKRVDFTRLTLNDLGLNKSLLGDHQVHRGLYRLGIDRNDAKYMTVKALLARNGDLYFTNFSARLSSIDDGAYEPNPDDINQQILKQNTKIEQNAKEVAIKANSVDVTRDIKGAVDGIKVGGVNLLRDTDLMSAQYWTANSSKAIYRNRRVPGANNALLDTSISSWISFNYKQKVIFDTSKEYTFSAYICSLQKGQSVTLWLNPDDTYKGSFQSATLTNSTDDYDWQRFSVTFKPKKSEAYLSISTFDIKTGQGVWLSSLMLEEGNKATSYTKAPEDTSAEIKSAKEAAIQVASDQINIHVNELSTSFDDKLNKRVNEVKTASEKFTSDGIEQTVTKITNVKNDVDRLGDNLRNTGARNLLHNTSDQYRTLTNDGAWLQKTTASSSLTSVANYHGGDEFTYAATVTNTSNQPVLLEFQNCGQDRRWLTGKHSLPVPAGAKDYRIAVSMPITTDTWFLQTWLIFQGGKGAPGEKIQVKDERLVEGVAPGSWSPNPDDINQQITNTNKKIDTQTLDSANIDQMKTQGHYFVRNLTGNPIGGWVYVDVTGNNNDRIRQDVYQDNGSKHMYRRGFNDTWSGWEQGAYLSDVNNVKTEVTASVKNLGDRVTTQVNSVETRIDNLSVGGRNYISPKNIKGYYAHEPQYNANTQEWTVAIDNGTGGAWGGGICFQGTGIVVPWGQAYTDSVEVYVTDSNLTWIVDINNGPVSGASWSGNDNDNRSTATSTPAMNSVIPTNQWYRLSVTAWNTNPRNTNHVGIYDGSGFGIINNTGHTVTVKFRRPKQELGSKATDWTPNPDDTVEAIREINTKWDVANGQIQGKVTATDVNNIINGKGYATQSWAQTQFQMKSDAITLQAVRNNITNGIQNQVNSIDQKLNNTKVGNRNLFVGTNRGDYGWMLSPGNGATSKGSLYIDGENGVRLTNSRKTTSWWVIQFPFDMNKLKPNTSYTISFDIRTPQDRNENAFIGLARGDSSGSPFVESPYKAIHTKANQFVHITQTLTTTSNFEKNQQAFYFNNAGIGQCDWVDIVNLMMVEGTQSAEWSPAPEEVGSGQNLLRGTADFSWPNGIGFNGNFNTSFERFDDTSITFHLWGSKGGGIYTQWGGAFPDGQLQVGETYTFSFDIKGSGTFSNIGNESHDTNARGLQVPGDWQRVSISGTIKALDKAFIIYFRDTFDVRIKNVKIERGSKQTPWIPHPFDNKDKGVNLLKSTAYWNPADWNHISDGKWYNDNWIDGLGHKAYGRSNAAWDGLGQTVYVTPGVYTWSAQIYLHGFEGNDSAAVYYGDNQYNGTVQCQQIRKPALNEQNKWINYSTTFYVRNAGNLCVRPELNQNHGTIHVGSQKLEHGMVATPWTPSPYDSDPQNIVSAINITPDNIKLSSKKIVIDGNTDIHGDLRTDRVRLVGKNGAIDMTGDTGIKMTNNDGSSMLLGRGNIDLTYKNDFRMNIDSSMITLMHRNIHINQGSPIAIGNIGAIFKTANNKMRGLSIRYNPGGNNDSLHGADFFDIGYNDPNSIGTVINQLEFTSKDMQLNTTRKRKGINFLDDINLQGYQKINVGDNDKEPDGKYSNDPLMIRRLQWSTSSQPDRYQPTISLGWDQNNVGSAGVTFLWDQVKPFGNRDISNLGDIWFNGIKFRFAWVHHGAMFNNQQQPAFYRVGDDGSVTSGIAFASGSTWDVGSGAWNITQAMINLKNRGML